MRKRSDYVVNFLVAETILKLMAITSLLNCWSLAWTFKHWGIEPSRHRPNFPNESLHSRENFGNTDFRESISLCRTGPRSLGSLNLQIRNNLVQRKYCSVHTAPERASVLKCRLD